MSTTPGQFEDADFTPSTDRAHHPSADSPGEPSEDSDKGCWDLDYEDWHGETSNFTKKLNAVRSGQAGANAQQGKAESGRGSSNTTQKALHVSVCTGVQ